MGKKETNSVFLVQYFTWVNKYRTGSDTKKPTNQWAIKTRQVCGIKRDVTALFTSRRYFE